MYPKKLRIFCCAELGKVQNSCGKLTLFHNLHRFFHRPFPQQLKFFTDSLVYIIDFDTFRLFPSFCSVRIMTVILIITPKIPLDMRGVSAGISYTAGL